MFLHQRELILSNKNILYCLVGLPQLNVSMFHHGFLVPRIVGTDQLKMRTGNLSFLICGSQHIAQQRHWLIFSSQLERSSEAPLPVSPGSTSFDFGRPSSFSCMSVGHEKSQEKMSALDSPPLWYVQQTYSYTFYNISL